MTPHEDELTIERLPRLEAEEEEWLQEASTTIIVPTHPQYWDNADPEDVDKASSRLRDKIQQRWPNVNVQFVRERFSHRSEGPLADEIEGWASQVWRETLEDIIERSRR
jgi:hypothetical protein